MINLKITSSFYMAKMYKKERKMIRSEKNEENVKLVPMHYHVGKLLVRLDTHSVCGRSLSRK